jgi:sulfate/thiosulfate transport system substrate-binding protein
MDSWRTARLRALLLVMLAVVAIFVALWAAQSLWLPDDPRALDVYAFSTVEELMTRRVFPEFAADWSARSGTDMGVRGVFGPSGTLAGQINLGAPADLAVLSHDAYVTSLKLGRRIRTEAEATVFCRSPMVIVTRAGNPAGLSAFEDLARAGVDVLHPDPRSSGAGAWGVLAVYGAALEAGASPAAAEQALQDAWAQVRYLAPSARAAMTLFELGAADALVTYEQDALLAAVRGVALEVVVPERTIVAEHVAVVVDDNVTRAEREVAEAFVEFLQSPAGQAACADYYLRPVDGGTGFALLQQPFTVDALGGWPLANAEIVKGIWEARILPGLELEPVGTGPGVGNG